MGKCRLTPVGPEGGICSIIEDVVCKVYFQKTDLEAKKLWIYLILSVCLWALSGPEVGYIQLLRTLCAKSIS